MVWRRWRVSGAECGEKAGEDGDVSVSFPPQGTGQQLCGAKSRGKAGHWGTPQILLQLFGNL